MSTKRFLTPDEIVQVRKLLKANLLAPQADVNINDLDLIANSTAQGGFSSLDCNNQDIGDIFPTITRDNQPATKKYVDDNSSNITVIDNLTSTSTTDALSANQGRVLEQQIQNIIQDTVFFDSSFDINVDDTILEFDFMTFYWDSTNNQILFEITDGTLDTCSFFRKTNNYTTFPTQQILRTRGDFGVSLSNFYYFSPAGTLDTNYDLNGQVSRDSVSFTIYATNTGLKYFFTLEVIRDTTTVVGIKGNYVEYTSLSAGRFAYRFEANELGNEGDYVFGFGSREGDSSIGQIIPVDIEFDQIALRFSQSLSVSNYAINIMKNGGVEKTIAVASGTGSDTITISPSISFSAGDRLSFQAGGSGQVTDTISVDAIISGTFST